MELKKGTILQGGKYEIINSLGQGGFGITYLAEQVLLRRTVAVKEFFMKDCCERDATTSQVTVGTGSQRELVNKFRGKFIREAQMIASMNHPNIVRVLDVFEENGTAYYVMDHLPGGSLSDKVKRDGPLSEHDAMLYINDISSALAYIHAHNTVHLDVKPSNVLLDGNGRAVLIDFGISKHYDDAGEQTSSTPVGISKGFAPLEQGRDGDVSQFKPSTDIYALGATLYYLLTGNVPPEASIVNEDGLERPTGISDRVWTAIERAMQPRRKDRPQSIGHFLSLLDGKSETAGQTAVDPDDETTRIDAAAFQSAPESKRTTAGASATGSRPRQESKPKQAPKTSQKTNPSNASRIDSVADRNNIPSKGFPKWLYGVAVALVLGLIVFLVIPKSKHVGDTPAPDKPEQEQTGTSNGHEWVDLGLSVKWATCNIGASSPSAYGDYYAWGETSTKSSYTWENYRFRTSGDSYDNVRFNKYNTQSGRGTVDNRTTLELSDDVARQKWGGSWRMPTEKEFQELIDNCTWTWTTMNGVKGYKVTGKKSGYTDRSIFLPAAGYRYDTSLNYAGEIGDYCSSSLYSGRPYDAQGLGFKYRFLYSGSDLRSRGLSVRPVCP